MVYERYKDRIKSRYYRIIDKIYDFLKGKK